MASLLGSLAKTLTPWERMGNAPGDFHLIGLGFSDGDCLTSIAVNIELLHRNPDSVGFKLTRVGAANNSPNAKNSTISVVLKTANASTSPAASHARSVGM